MSDEPSYLGLLNRVSLGESNAYCYLSEWAQVTDDPDVRRVLLTVAAREGEHGLAFAKRINELGFELQPNPDDKTLEGKLEIVRAACSDLEKMEALGFGKVAPEGKPDVFDDFFSDHSIDIQTGELLGRIGKIRRMVRRDAHRVACEPSDELVAIAHEQHRQFRHGNTI